MFYYGEPKAVLNRGKMKWWVYLNGHILLKLLWNWQFDANIFFSEWHKLSNFKTIYRLRECKCELKVSFR